MEIIKKVKESVQIPVIGNGDVVDKKSAQKLFEYTNCDGIMIARGALYNPFIFDEILNNSTHTEKEKIQLIFNHIWYIKKYSRNTNAVCHFRKQLMLYLKGLPNANLLKQKVLLYNEWEDVEEAIKEYIKYM